MSVKIATAAFSKKFFARHYVLEPCYIIQTEILGSHKHYRIDCSVTRLRRQRQSTRHKDLRAAELFD